MAEIVFPAGKARAVVIPGQEAFNDTAKALVTIPKCALIKFGANGAELNTDPYPAGVALEVGDPGDQGFGYGTHTEISGFSNALTPGALVYPSSAVAGGLTDDPDDAVDDPASGAPVPCGRVTPEGKRIKIFCI